MKTANKKYNRVHVAVCTPNLNSSGGVGTLTAYALAHGSAAVDATVLITRNSPRFPFFSIARALGVVALLTIASLRGQLDVVHVNLGSGGSTLRKMIILAWSQKVLRVPTVVQIHSSRFFEFVSGLPGFARSFIRHRLEGAEKVLVLGHVWRTEFFNAFTDSKANVDVLRLGVPRFTSTRIDPGLTEVHLDLIFVGDLAEYKGLDVLLYAFSDDLFRDDRLKVIGPGNIAHWAALANELGISERVQFLGKVDTAVVNQELSRSSAFVLPSLNEGFPVSIMEAASAGVPIVASDVGAITEVFVDGADILLVKPGSVLSLKTALQHLKDGRLRRQIGQAAYEKWVLELSATVTSEKLETIWKMAAGRQWE